MIKRMRPRDGLKFPNVDGVLIDGPAVVDTDSPYIKRLIASGDLVEMPKAKSTPKKDVEK